MIKKDPYFRASHHVPEPRTLYSSLFNLAGYLDRMKFYGASLSIDRHVYESQGNILFRLTGYIQFLFSQDA